MMMSLSLTCEPCRYKLYTINCLVERSWRFGLPLVLAGINGKIMFFPAYLACFSRRLCCPCIVLPASLMPEARSGSAGGFQTVAVVGFFSPLAVMALGPWCGQLLDLTPRRTALRFIAVVQFAAIVTAGKPLLCSALWATLQNTSVRILPNMHSITPEGLVVVYRTVDGVRSAPGPEPESAAQLLLSGSVVLHNGGAPFCLCLGHCHRERLDHSGAKSQSSSSPRTLNEQVACSHTNPDTCFAMRSYLERPTRKHCQAAMPY